MAGASDQSTTGSAPEPSPAEQLLALLESARSDSAADCRWVQVVAGCLKLCRAHRALWDDLHASHQADEVSGPLMAIDQDILDAIAYAGSPARGVLIPPPTVQLLLDAVRAMIAEVEPSRADGWAVAMAHRIAVHIDEHCHATFEEFFREQLRFEVEEGEPYPVASWDPRRVMGEGSSASTPPEDFASHRLDQTPHLRLGDQITSHYRFTLDWDLRDRLRPLSSLRTLTIASVHLIASNDDCDIKLNHEQRTFRHRGPKSATNGQDHAQAVAELPPDDDPALVVIPEYCVSDAQRAPLLAGLSNLARRPILVIAGSALVPGEHGGHVNEALLWAFGVNRSPIQKSVTKLSPAQVEIDGERYREDIAVDGRPTVTIWRSGPFALAVLLCWDGSDAGVLDALGALGANLLVVPSFSPKTATIWGMVRQLGVRSQAFVFYANAPRSQDPDRIEAAIAGPWGMGPSELVSVGGSAQAGPGSWVASTRERALRWRPHQGSEGFPGP